MISTSGVIIQGYMNLFNYGNIKITLLIFCSLLCSFIMLACQATPSNNIIKNKSEDVIISDNSDNAEIESNNTLEYTINKNGNRIRVSAETIFPDTNKFPVAKLQERKWVEEELETIMKGIIPEATIYKKRTRSKDDVMDEIIELRKNLSEGHENHDGKNIVKYGDGSVEIVEINMDNKLADLEKEYETLPDLVVDEEPEYRFTYNEEQRQDIAEFSLKCDSLYHSAFFCNGVEPVFSYINPRFSGYSQEIEIDINHKYLDELKPYVDEILSNIGADYMALDRAFKVELIDDDTPCYKLIYTRQINGVRENYIGSDIMNNIFEDILLPLDDSTEKQNFNAPWSEEYIDILILQDEVLLFSWHNPSKLIEVESENVTVLSLDDIRNEFDQYMNIMLSDRSFGQSFVVDKAILGLTKTRIPNSSEFRLIPAWAFYGTYDYDEPTYGYNSEYYFCIISALDGRVINRKSGY